MRILWIVGAVLCRGFGVRVASGHSVRKVGLWIIFLLIVNGDALFPFVGQENRAIIQDRPGCYMDGIYRPFGARWSPVFEPQGLMVCIKCQCLTVEKKGVVQSKGDTICRNIKDLCPVPECDQPVLKSGRCCKSCVGKDDFESSFTIGKVGALHNDIYSFDDAKASQPQDFQALLVGRHVLGGPVRTRAVAVANIRVTKGRVKFAIRYSNLDRPKSFMLQDIHGNVIFEKSIKKDNKGDKKVCELWSKIPGFYLRYLRQEKLFATLTTSRYPEGVASGKILPKSMTNTETFSAILAPSKPDGNGGLVLIHYTPGSGLFSYVMTLESLRSSWKKGNLHLTVLRGSRILYQAVGSVIATTGTVSGSWKLSKQHRRQLARGRLQVKVTFLDLPSLKGVIRPRIVCGVFQAVLSRSEAVVQKQAYSSGSAVLHLGEDGRLDYSIKVTGLADNITRVRLENASSKYGHDTRFASNLFKSDNSSQHFPLQEWTNGTYRKLEAEEVFHLLNNQLFVTIATARQRVSELRGRLVSFEYDEHFIDTAIPVSLVPANEEAHGDVAHTWLSLDADCVLHFDATVAGAGKRPESFDVVLGSHDNRQRIFVLKQPMGKLELPNSYRHTAGEVTNIPDDLLLALDRGQAFVQLNTKKSGEAIFRGNVTLSNSCWRYSNDVSADYAEEDEAHFPSSDQDDVPVCNFEGHNYEEGSMWLPDVNPECTTCSCVAGKTLCQRVICPTLSCRTPVLRQGDCCPSCPYEDDSETCQIGKDPRKYRVHSIWHPYLPMEGFTKCAVCRCFPGGKVECDKSPCPVPGCPKSQWMKSQTDPCCYECRSSIISAESSQEEPQQDQNVNGACTFMEQTKSNGDKWHPNIQPFGHMKCFLCECQDGNVNCGRTKCPELTCSRKVKHTGRCCEECDSNQDQPPAPAQDSVSRLNNDTRINKGCRFGEKQFRNGQRWQPISSPTGSGDCAVCRCKQGSAKCRLRCPRVCQEDLSKDPCCKHCSDKIKAKTAAKIDVTKASSVVGLSTLVPLDDHDRKSRFNRSSQLEMRSGQNKPRKGNRPRLLDTSDFVAMFS